MLITLFGQRPFDPHPKFRRGERRRARLGSLGHDPRPSLSRNEEASTGVLRSEAVPSHYINKEGKCEFSGEGLHLDGLDSPDECGRGWSLRKPRFGFMPGLPKTPAPATPRSNTLPSRG